MNLNSEWEFDGQKKKKKEYVKEQSIWGTSLKCG